MGAARIAKRTSRRPRGRRAQRAATARQKLEARRYTDTAGLVCDGCRIPLPPGIVANVCGHCKRAVCDRCRREDAHRCAARLAADRGLAREIVNGIRALAAAGRSAC